MRISLSIAALSFVALQLDIPQLQKTLGATDPGWFLIALGTYTLSKVISAQRLSSYLNVNGIVLSAADNLRLYFIGMFYNLFLPGGIGGDAYKVWLLHRDRQVPVRNSIQAMLLDRVSGVVALASLAFLFGWFAFREWPHAGWLLAGSVILLPTMYFVHWILGRQFMPITTTTTATAMVVQLLQVISAWALLQGLHVADIPATYLTVFLVSSLVSVLPISVGGIGLRELVFVTAAKYSAVSPESAVAFSLLFFVVTALSSLPGGFVSSRK